MYSKRTARPNRVVRVLVAMLAVCAASRPNVAQPPTTVPPDGLRDNTPAVHALVNAKLVLSPGRSIERGTVVVRDGVIVAVGASADVTPPAEARVWDLAGREVYPGLIDAYSEMSDGESRAAPAGEGQELLRTASATSERRQGSPPGITGGATHWNPRVAPQFRADRVYRPDAESNKKFRSQGIVARLVAPSRQVIKGISAAVTTADESGSRSILRPIVAMHVQLTPAGAAGTERVFPVSPMGAVTLVRQAVYDAQWYARARAAWQANPSLPRPEANDALEALQPVLAGQLPLFVDAPDELYALRADRLAKEFNLRHVVVRGSGQEYRRAEDISSTGLPLVLPVNFAKAPNVASPESALAYSLEELMDWDLQPENPARLQRAGAKIALTSHGLRDRGEFLKSVRRAVARGLDKDAALKALTTTPAELLGIGRSHGSIEVGKAASFVVADGDLFAETTRVLETWVDGKRYEVVPAPKEDLRGTWAVRLGEGKEPVTVKLTGEPHKLKGTVKAGAPSAQNDGWLWIDDPSRAKGSFAGSPPNKRSAGAKLANVGVSASQLAFTFKGDAVGMAGVVQVSATAAGDAWLGRGVTADGSTFAVTAHRVAKYSREEERREREREARERKTKEAGGGESSEEAGPATTVVTAEGQPAEPAAAKPTEPVASAPRPTAEPPPGEAERPTTQVQPAAQQQPPATQPASAAVAGRGEKAADKPALFEPNYPLGAFGRTSPPEQPSTVVFTNATVWTCGPLGKLEGGTVLVEKGKVTGVFRRGEPLEGLPAAAVVIDCDGKHITPGIIDCHSHIATDGGVNESSQSITCEVRIGDFVNPDDVNVYRQLAGGVTAANVLHGSANTIG
ncbi:MAG TPA: amidohydrolase family protein, partial [Tepidisphaeraceae bacterium]|nr:amidohydrolase family protein [Tepidisphaeraceae bacterium]